MYRLACFSAFAFSSAEVSVIIGLDLPRPLPSNMRPTEAPFVKEIDLPKPLLPRNSTCRGPFHPKSQPAETSHNSTARNDWIPITSRIAEWCARAERPSGRARCGAGAGVFGNQIPISLQSGTQLQLSTRNRVRTLEISVLLAAFCTQKLKIRLS